MFKLFSLNIEGDRHIDKITSFLQREEPDVICFQEVFKVDLPIFEKTLRTKAFFIPTMDVREENIHLSSKGLWGLGIFSKQEIKSFNKHYYVGEESKIPQFIKENPNSGNRAVSWITFKIDDRNYKIATTHFTWSPDGEATDEQRTTMEKLLIMLQKIEPFVLCGDFNAPRGKEIFQMLGEKYKDNIPQEITSTIDPTLHRDGDLNYVVDGLFTTSDYVVDSVQIIGGLSDHKGISALIG